MVLSHVCFRFWCFFGDDSLHLDCADLCVDKLILCFIVLSIIFFYCRSLNSIFNITPFILLFRPFSSTLTALLTLFKNGWHVTEGRGMLFLAIEYLTAGFETAEVVFICPASFIFLYLVRVYEFRLFHCSLRRRNQTAEREGELSDLSGMRSGCGPLYTWNTFLFRLSGPLCLSALLCLSVSVGPRARWHTHAPTLTLPHSYHTLGACFQLARQQQPPDGAVPDGPSERPLPVHALSPAFSGFLWPSLGRTGMSVGMRGRSLSVCARRKEGNEQTGSDGTVPWTEIIQ